MNIYARYFDQETVVSSFEELINFLTSIQEINITTELLDNLKAYIDSSLPYPKRYKLRPRVYFILIKTTAKTLQEFKSNRHKEAVPSPTNEVTQNYKEERTSSLKIPQPGWYKTSLSIKRMVHIKELQKFQYQDNTIEAYIKAEAPIDCYNRLIEYLNTRQDIDPRSQIPSAKSESFKFAYIGTDVQFTEPQTPELHKANAETTAQLESPATENP